MNRLLRASVAAVLLAAPLASCGGAQSAGGARASADVVDVSLSPADALEKARSGVERRSKDSAAWFGLGVAWQRNGAAGVAGAADSALAAFEKAVELDGKNARALVHRGLVLEDLTRYDEALASYQAASEVAPDDALPWINIGSLLYFHYKKTYEAKTALTKALELDPDNADAHFNLGVLFADASLFGEAVTEWERVVELDPESPAGQLARDNLDRIRPLLADPGNPAGAEQSGS